MSPKPTPQEIEYEQKQFLLALLDRRLQLINTLCLPHVYPNFSARVNQLVGEAQAILDTGRSPLLDATGETGPAPVVNTVVMPSETVKPERPEIKFELALVVLPEQSVAIREAVGKDFPYIETILDGDEQGTVRLTIAAYDYPGRTHVHRTLRDLISAGVVTFDIDEHIEMGRHISFMMPVSHTSLEARARINQNKQEKDKS